jgi:hypothetical protein
MRANKFRSRKPFLAVEALAASTGSDQKLIRQSHGAMLMINGFFLSLCRGDFASTTLGAYLPLKLTLISPPSTEPLTTCIQ